MQHKAFHLLFCKFTLHVSRVNHTHHQGTQKFNYSLRYWSYFLYSQASLDMLDGSSCTKNMTSTGGCSYSFVYS